ncbi:MAG: amidase domain-containing protein [Lachnospiraceae bacterium]|nr:amidase domain-containing protein [Lachnospiraceae bacterium]
MRNIPYNRTAAVAYARRWAWDRNPAYYNFDNIGGDCTNFASQCLYAGARVMNYTPVMGWFYLSLQKRTPSWSGVEYLYNFLISNKSVGPYAHVVSQAEALPGDIVQLGTASGDFYHSPVITAISPIILVAAHSDNALDRPLYTYNYGITRFLHIDGVRTW